MEFCFILLGLSVVLIVLIINLHLNLNEAKIRVEYLEDKVATFLKVFKVDASNEDVGNK